MTRSIGLNWTLLEAPAPSLSIKPLRALPIDALWAAKALHGARSSK